MGKAFPGLQSDTISARLFENHLAFLEAHRGDIIRGDRWIRIEGQAPFLSFWTPLGERASIPDDCDAVRLIPQSGTGWEDRLRSNGYLPGERLAYMVLDETNLLAPQSRAHGTIVSVSDEAAALDFAQVQTAGFLTEDSDDRNWWVSCFARMAVANYARTDQSFFIAYHDGTPAAVLLLVHAAGLSGIYAVATDPRFQRRGLSTQLLHKAASDAEAHATDGLILQAVIGSYAHGFYKRLGFVDVFESPVWRQASLS